MKSNVIIKYYKHNPKYKANLTEKGVGKYHANS